MPSDVRALLADAAAAEARGDKSAAIESLRKAAELYRDANNPSRAMKMLKHIRRLEGVDDEGAFGGGEGFTVVEGGATGSPPHSPRRVQRVLEERAPALADPGLAAWCSFCCKPSVELGPVVSGPTGCFICTNCVALSGQLLGGPSVPPAPHAGPRRTHPEAGFHPLPQQQAAWQSLRGGRGKLALLLGPAGSGKSTLLRALSGQGGPFVLDVERPLDPHQEDGLLERAEQRRAVVAVRAQAPQPALTLSGELGVEALYDTPSLVKACSGLVSETVLAQVDLVAVLPALDSAGLQALAGALVAARGDGLTLPATVLAQVVALAERSGRGAHELAVLIARIPPGQWT